jgi:cyclopropane fatty-acyl-phospholipid synthase-like methyltransferase
MIASMLAWVRRAARRVPILGPTASAAAKVIRRQLFPGSSEYWEARYRSGGISGPGSRGAAADFKARVLNDFVRDRGIGSVVEFGTGDGYQLSLAAYPRYIGLDVSATAISACRERFADDPTKTFVLYEPDTFSGAAAFSSDLALSLDVIFHLVEDRVFERYMAHLFACATSYVAIYSSNTAATSTAPHVRHRRFTDWTERHRLDWKLEETILNPGRQSERPDAILADFYFFSRI